MNDKPVTLMITFYPDDIEDIKRAFYEGRDNSGIFEHILAEYKSATSKGADNA